ncbi:hypothetical protein [Ahniella affigens]|uniref:hypothetical protein n=1 Tax=Ahniella affigens TaxID=2021234 RepID=UPI001474FEED|nr:hypothetical protein [Ahniella affigens]
MLSFAYCQVQYLNIDYRDDRFWRVLGQTLVGDVPAPMAAPVSSLPWIMTAYSQ